MAGSIRVLAACPDRTFLFYRQASSNQGSKQRTSKLQQSLVREAELQPFHRWICLLGRSLHAANAGFEPLGRTGRLLNERVDRAAQAQSQRIPGEMEAVPVARISWRTGFIPDSRFFGAECWGEVNWAEINPHEPLRAPLFASIYTERECCVRCRKGL